jgi:hypothetical protein
MAEHDRTDWNDPATVPKTASPETVSTATPEYDAPPINSKTKKAEPLPHRKKK